MYAIFNPNEPGEIDIGNQYQFLYSDNFIKLFADQSTPAIEMTNSQDAVLIIYGEIYNGRKALKQYGYHCKNDLHSSLITLMKNGHFKILAELNGSYCLFFFDKKDKILKIASDRYGSRRLFYGSKGSQFHISSEIDLFDKFDYQSIIDFDKVFQLLAFRYFVTDVTIFEKVRVFPYGSVLEIGDEGFRFTRFWDWKFLESNSQENEREIVNSAASIWKNSISSRLEGKDKVCIPLSGGLDSRAILAATMEMKSSEDIITFTGGSPGTYDFEIGKMVARKAGVRNISMDHTKEVDFKVEYLNRCKETQACTDFFNNFYSSDWDKVSKLSQNTFLGFMGGELAGSHINQEMISKNNNEFDISESALSIILANHRLTDDNTLGNLLSMPAIECNQRLIKIIENGNERNTCKKLPNFCDHWDYSHRQFNYINPTLFTQKSNFNYLIPFIDNNWVDFTTSISPDMRYNQKWYKAFLIKEYPFLFSLPSKNNRGLPINQKNPASFLNASSDLMNTRIAKNLKNFTNSLSTFINYPVYTFQKWNYHPNKKYTRNIKRNINYGDFSFWLRTADSSWGKVFNEALHQSVDAKIINPKELDRLMIEHMNGNDKCFNPLLMIASIGFIINKYDPKIIYKPE